MCADGDAWFKTDCGFRRVDLSLADPVNPVNDLTLEVGFVDLVHVDNAEGADPGGCKIERCRRTESAGTEQQNLGVKGAAPPRRLRARADVVDMVALGRAEGTAEPGLPASFHPLKPPSIDTAFV